MKRIVVDILDDDEGAITLEDALTGKVAEDTVLEKLGVDGSDEPRHKRRSLSFSDRGGKKRDGGKGSPTSSKEKPSEPAVPQSAPRAASSKDAPEASKPADVVLIEDDERDDTTAVDIVQEISRHSESSEASSEAFLEGLTALQAADTLLRKNSKSSLAVEEYDAPAKSRPSVETVILSVSVPGKEKPYEFKLKMKDPFDKIHGWIEKVLYFKAEDICLKWHGITLEHTKAPAFYAMDEKESVTLTLIPKHQQSQPSQDPASSGSQPQTQAAAGTGEEAPAAGEPRIRIKVQLEESKTVHKFLILRSDPIKKLVDGFRRKAELLEKVHLVLKFDGETLDPAKSLEECGIEDDDQVDAVVSK